MRIHLAGRYAHHSRNVFSKRLQSGHVLLVHGPLVSVGCVRSGVNTSMFSRPLLVFEAEDIRFGQVDMRPVHKIRISLLGGEPR